MMEFPDYIFIDDSTIEFSIRDNIIRSEMSNGMDKTKPRQSLTIQDIKFSVSMHRDSLNDFNKWFESLQFGSLFFLMRNPLMGNVKKYRFSNTEFSWKKSGNLYSSTFELESYNE